MAIELLQHALERFGVVTVLDVTLYDIATGKPTLFLDTLKISSITSETQEKQIKGGRFADLLIVYNYDRMINLEFQDALLSASTMKELWGSELERDPEKIVEHKKGEFMLQSGEVTVGALKGIQFVFNKTKDVEYTFDDSATPEDLTYDFVAATGEVVVTDAAAANDDVILVYYTVEAPSAGFSPVEALLKSSSFPKTVKFVGQTFFIEESSGKQILAEIEIPKLKLNSNFTVTMEAEGDASVFDFSGMALVENTTNRNLIKFKTLRYLD